MENNADYECDVRPRYAIGKAVEGSKAVTVIHVIALVPPSFDEAYGLALEGDTITAMEKWEAHGTRKNHGVTTNAPSRMR